MGHELSLLTLFTDAGFDNDLRVGVWAKYEGNTHRNSGILRGVCAHSSQAELVAITCATSVASN